MLKLIGYEIAIWRKKIELIFDVDDDALEKWMESFTQSERMDIARELAIIGERILKERGNPKAAEESASLLQSVADWEETYLNMEVCNLKQAIAEADYIKSIEAMRSNIDTLRAYMLESINNNAPNAQELYQLHIWISPTVCGIMPTHFGLA